jgi:hypothetical protein
VREHVIRRDALTGEQVLGEVGLLEDRVRMSAGLRGQTEAEQVERQYAVACRERRPDGFPVPRRGREAVDQQQRFVALRAGLEDEDGVAAEVDEVAGAGPFGWRDARGRGGGAGARIDGSSLRASIGWPDVTVPARGEV